MKNLFLCCVILVLGTIAVENFTQAKPDDPAKKVNADLDISFDLSDSDLDKINGIVNEKIDPIREDLRTVEKSLSDRINDLQNKIADCNTRFDAVKASMVAPVVKAAPVVKSAGSSGNAVANKYEPKSSVVYSQPVVRSSHWTHPGDITTHMQTSHGQNVSGMTVEQQLSLHDAIHESQSKPASVARTVTRSNVQTSKCPGGVCPTNASSVTRSYSRPRLFRR